MKNPKYKIGDIVIYDDPENLEEKQKGQYWTLIQSKVIESYCIYTVGKKDYDWFYITEHLEKEKLGFIEEKGITSKL